MKTINKILYLYGESLDERFRLTMLMACKEASRRLKAELDKEILKGISSRTDDLHEAIKWWKERAEEFRDY